MYVPPLLPPFPLPFLPSPLPSPQEGHADMHSFWHRCRKWCGFKNPPPPPPLLSWKVMQTCTPSGGIGVRSGVAPRASPHSPPPPPPPPSLLLYTYTYVARSTLKGSNYFKTNWSPALCYVHMHILIKVPVSNQLLAQDPPQGSESCRLLLPL